MTPNEALQHRWNVVRNRVLGTLDLASGDTPWGSKANIHVSTEDHWLSSWYVLLETPCARMVQIAALLQRAGYLARFQGSLGRM
jgi:hypothetical protein